MSELAKAMSDESTTLSLLTNIVTEGVSLTAMVAALSEFSTSAYPRGKPALSVSRALTLMGWDSVAAA